MEFVDFLGSDCEDTGTCARKFRYGSTPKTKKVEDDLKKVDSYMRKSIDRLNYYEKLELVERRKSYVKTGKQLLETIGKGNHVKLSGTQNKLGRLQYNEPPTLRMHTPVTRRSEKHTAEWSGRLQEPPTLQQHSFSTPETRLSERRQENITERKPPLRSILRSRKRGSEILESSWDASPTEKPSKKKKRVTLFEPRRVTRSFKKRDFLDVSDNPDLDVTIGYEETEERGATIVLQKEKYRDVEHESDDEWMPPGKKRKTRRSTYCAGAISGPQSTQKIPSEMDALPKTTKTRRSVCSEVDARPQSTRKRTRRSSVYHSRQQNVKKTDQLRHMAQSIENGMEKPLDVMVSSRLYRRKNVEVSYDEIVRRLSSPEKMASEDVCRYVQRPLNQAPEVDRIRHRKKRVEDGQFSAFSLLLEEDVSDIAEALGEYMKKVDLTHLEPPAENFKNVRAVLQAVSKTFQNNERFEKLTHGGSKIVAAVLNVVGRLFETGNNPQDIGEQLRTFLARRKSLK